MNNILENALKPKRIAAKTCPPHPTPEPHFFPFVPPALGRHMPHALTQLRLARTHDRIEIEIDLPVEGQQKLSFPSTSDQLHNLASLVGVENLLPGPLGPWGGGGQGALWRPFGVLFVNIVAFFAKKSGSEIACFFS